MSTALAARSSSTPMTSSLGDAPEPGTSSAIDVRYGISATGASSTTQSRATSTTPAFADCGNGRGDSKPRNSCGWSRHCVPTPWQVGDHGNAVTAQLLGRPDAREEQQMRRHRRPGAEHDLVATEDLHGARPFDFDTDRTFADEHDTPRRDAALDRQIGAIPMRCDVRHRRVEPNTVDDVARQRAVSRTFRERSCRPPRGSRDRRTRRRMPDSMDAALRRRNASRASGRHCRGTRRQGSHDRPRAV